MFVKSRIAVAGVGLACVAGAGGAIAATASDGTQVTPSQFQAGMSATPPAQVPASLASKFSVLARAATSSDALPADFVAQHSESALERVSGANLALAHRASGLTTGPAWVVPGAGWTCLIASQYSNGAITGTVCGSNAPVMAGKLMMAAGAPSAPGGLFIAGLVPDGVSDVSVVRTDGSSIVAPVHDNVYTAVLQGQGASAVTFTDSAGSERLPLSSP